VPKPVLSKQASRSPGGLYLASLDPRAVARSRRAYLRLVSLPVGKRLKSKCHVIDIPIASPK